VVYTEQTVTMAVYSVISEQRNVTLLRWYKKSLSGTRQKTGSKEISVCKRVIRKLAIKA
jgi:hypothetical protein